MTAENDPPPEPTGPVELEPLVTRAEPLRHVEQSCASVTQAPDGVGFPVPARPLHECPQCEYILTGLTSRRCPECGEPFTLSAARWRSFLQSPRSQEDLRVVRANRRALWVGVGLQLASLIVPMVVLIGDWRGGQLFFWGISLSILTIACAVKGCFALSWSVTMLAAGLTSAVVAAMLLIVFA